MKQLFRFIMIIVTIVGMITIVSSQGFGYDVQQWYNNNMTETAFDLTKIIAGDVNVTGAIHDKFNQHEVTHPQGTHTVIHWHDGSVAPAEGTWACFNVHPGSSADVICALWTDINGNFIGVAGPVVSNDVSPEIGLVHVKLSNDWVYWNGNAYPVEEDSSGNPVGQITGSEVYYTFTTTEYPLEQLNDSLINALSWTSLSGFTLNYEDSIIYSVVNTSNLPVMLFRFDASGPDTGQVLTSREIIQYRVYPVPALTEWGMIILLALLLLSGIIVIRRRKALAHH